MSYTVQNSGSDHRFPKKSVAKNATSTPFLEPFSETVRCTHAYVVHSFRPGGFRQKKELKKEGGGGPKPIPHSAPFLLLPSFVMIITFRSVLRRIEFANLYKRNNFLQVFKKFSKIQLFFLW